LIDITLHELESDHLFGRGVLVFYFNHKYKWYRIRVSIFLHIYHDIQI